MIIPYKGKSPVIHENSFIAPGCVIVGDVTIDTECSVWFGAVIRGDINWIRIGAWTNIQDGCVVHVTHDTAPTEIGDHVTIGHGAIIHGCKIESSCLIGMGAIILDKAVIGSGSLVAAGSVVKSGMIIPPGSMVAGNPAIMKRRISSDERKYFVEWAENYRQYSKGYSIEAFHKMPDSY
jgi:carbonic anhydrase/acetyltransferase-like protein (isoleucine patch superfamily)